MMTISRYSPAPTASRLSSDRGPDRGALVEVARDVTHTHGIIVYVAGNDRTIKRMREVLVSCGMERNAVKWERFS